jgi:SAM-dependent methyltransferase
MAGVRTLMTANETQVDAETGDGVRSDNTDRVEAAEYVDVFAVGAGGHLSTRLPDVLRGVRPAGPVADLGAGTGLGTVTVADCLPDARVYAVERSPGVRAVLLSRITARADLRSRVSVVAGDLFTVDLPDRWGVAVAVHLVCQLSPQQRRRLWRLFAQRLAPGGFALLDRHYGPAGKTVAERLSASVTIGDHVYERWYSAQPVSPEAVLVCTTYRVRRDGRLVDEQQVSRTGWVVSEAEILAEASDAGLACEVVDEDFVRLSHR